MVNHTYQHQFITDFQFHSLLAVKIHTLQGPIIITTAYANPDTYIPFHDFNRLFDRNNIPIFFAGDLNANHTDLFHPRANAHGRQLIALFNAKRLHYIGPDFYTYFGPQGGKGRPDLVFGNRAALPYHTYCAPGPLVGSDHIPVEITISTSPIQHPVKQHFCYSTADWEAFQAGLDAANLDDRCNVEGVDIHTLDEHWHLVFDTIKTQMLQNIPQVAHKIRASFRPSIRTKRLLLCYRNRFLQNYYRLNRVQWDLTILRNHILNSFYRDRSEYWADLVRKIELHRVVAPQEFWTQIRRLKGTNHQHFSHLSHNGMRVSDPSEVIPILKDHWEGVFSPHETHPIARDNVNFVENWLLQHTDDITPLPEVNLATLDRQNSLIAPILLSEVKDNISQLRRKAPGGTQIGREVIRHLPDSVLRTVTGLFNASLATGYFPVQLKKAIIILIPKPGKDHTDPANFRPISLLEVLGKIFEKIINARLRIHLEDNDLLTKKQFGFRQHRSTQDALNIMVNYSVNNADRQLKTIMVTKDIEKAFDTVWHAGLKYKLCNNFNLPPLTCKLLCSFLDDRQCTIKFLGRMSETFTPQAGVPQGSGLSPTEFIMYTTDLPDPRHDDSLTILYADDCTQLTRAGNLTAAVRKMNRELDAVSRWEQKWRIQTNQAKTQVICFKAGKCRDAIDSVYLNTFEQRPWRRLPFVTQCKVLGVTFDSQLRFNIHASSKTKQAKQALQLLYRFGNASTPTKRHLYQALVKPHLTYCPMALSLTANTRQRNLQIVQNISLRWVNGIRRLDFITNEAIHESTKNTPALNIVRAQHLYRQLMRLQTWNEHWHDELGRLAREGFRPRIGIARNFLDVDYLDEDPMY